MRAAAAAWAAVALLVVAPPQGSAAEPELGEVGEGAQRAALERALGWLAAHPSDAGDRFGDRAMDAWSWSLFARLHPDPALRAHCSRQAELRLRALPVRVEATANSLSWWSLLLRERRERGVETERLEEALAALDLEEVLARISPTSAFWTAQLLRHAGFPLGGKSRSHETAVARSARKGAGSFRASLHHAYAIYHEIAPAADLGRREVGVFDAEQLAFVRGAVPDLLRVSLEAGDTDALAEVLVTAALLGMREDPSYRRALRWLLDRQLPDGSFRRAQGQRGKRHTVLVGSFALLIGLPPTPGALPPIRAGEGAEPQSD